MPADEDKEFQTAVKDVDAAQKALAKHQQQIAKFQTSMKAQHNKIKGLAKQLKDDPKAALKYVQESQKWLAAIDKTEKLHRKETALVKKLDKAKKGFEKPAKLKAKQKK